MKGPFKYTKLVPTNVFNIALQTLSLIGERYKAKDTHRQVIVPLARY